MAWEMGNRIADTTMTPTNDSDPLHPSSAYQVVVYFTNPVPADLSHRILEAYVPMLGVWFDDFKVAWVSLGGSDALAERVLGEELFTSSTLEGWTVLGLKEAFMNHPVFEGYPVDSVAVYELIEHPKPPQGIPLWMLAVAGIIGVGIVYYLYKKRKK